MKKLVLASSNQGKIRELRDQLTDLGWEVVPQSDSNIPDADETGLSFVENAIIKARHAAKLSGLPAIADDSGLEVDALNGAPGIHSARYSGESATDASNIDKLLQELNGVPEEQRTARFHCVLVLLKHEFDPVPIICHGSWEGVITSERSGGNGFGYDPVFFVPEAGVCSAELAPSRKRKMSHRAKALVKLRETLTDS